MLVAILLLSACRAEADRSTSAPAKPVTLKRWPMDGEPYILTGFDAMLDAVILNNKAVALALLDERSFDVNLKISDDRWTLLHLAAQYDRQEIGEMLLKHGAVVNPRNRGGATPLHVALANKHPEMASLLRTAGGTE